MGSKFFYKAIWPVVWSGAGIEKYDVSRKSVVRRAVRVLAHAATLSPFDIPASLSPF